MKMRFVRQNINKGEDNQRRLTGIPNQDPLEYAFPQIEEYFMYTPKAMYPVGNPSAASGTKGIKMSKDSISYCTSGLVDRTKGSTLSYLHKAIKAVNQLRMIEDRLVIYRLSRAPERNFSHRCG